MFSRFTSTMLAAAVLAISAPAFANFQVDLNPGGEKLFIDKANKDADNFFGSVSANNSGPLVNIQTKGLVDTGSGYANIKPVKDGFLTELLFTPLNPNLFGDFSFRGQLERGVDTVTLIVQDNQGNSPQIFFFTGLGGGNDFSRVGIVTTDNETIKSITLVSNFKEVKQIDFSVAPGVPEPETYALMLAGLGVVGFMARGRKV